MQSTATLLSERRTLSTGGRLLLTLLARLAWIATLMVVVAIALFFMVRLIPGDPARLVAGRQATAAQVAVVRHQLGLTGSLGSQLWDYLTRLGHLDLGHSLTTGQSVTSILAQGFTQTLELVGLALVLMFVVSITLGIGVAALTANGSHPKLDAVFSAVTSMGQTLPSYLAATLFVLVFAVVLPVLPVAGNNGIQYAILPALAISLANIAGLARVVRAETLNALSQDYAQLARSKRLPPLAFYMRHILRNVLSTSLAMGGIFTASLLGGTIVVEGIFAWPGIGTALVQGVLNDDYPVIQGVVLSLGLLVIVLNTAIDLITRLLDPRVTR